ncbi:phosphoribosylanthranilate isomerase [Candidatus Bathyarchaeota archaeon]|jgi:phosphoribosylanthranilate isomerase|nr:phosphoribosylanthranilate isomerase [Candidatus Bathyarchaeota archaeon]
MTVVRVKICGITRKEDLDAAAESGADAVGFVVGVVSSPRNLSLIEAENLIRQVPPFLKSVLVTVPRSINDLTAYEKLNPDIIQIHGEKLNAVDSFRTALPKTQLIGAINANFASDSAAVFKTAKLFSAVLLDSFVVGQHGGTGVVHDWGLSKRVKQVIQPKPLILAGGLNPENVAEAVHTVKPYAVDVSSGVEQQPGIKSRKKIVEFIKNAKDVKI